jgi:hypothetical protein
VERYFLNFHCKWGILIIRINFKERLEMKNTRLICFLVGFVLTLYVKPAYALVDYGSFDGSTSVNSAPSTMKPRRKITRSSKGKGAISKAKSSVKNSIRNMFKVNTKFENLGILGTKEDTIDILSMSAMLNTPYGVYFNFSYWEGSASYNKFLDEGFFEGNINIASGLNWFQVGQGMDKTRLDIYAGVSFPAEIGEIGRTSMDKYIGIQTIKKIFDFYLNIDLQAKLHGSPEDKTEPELGTAFMVSPELAFVATSDIRFALKATIVNIQAYNNDDEVKTLSENASFSYISPRLDLLLSPYFNIELGGHIRMKELSKERVDELKSAKLFEFKGLYGNAFFASVNLSI